MIHQSVLGMQSQKDSCLSSELMKERFALNASADWVSHSPKFYPLDQQNWEDEIVWGNSPSPSEELTESSLILESDTEPCHDVESARWSKKNLLDFGSIKMCYDNPILTEKSDQVNVLKFSCRSYHPQLLRLERTLLKDDEDYAIRRKNVDEQRCLDDFVRRFGNISIQNRDLLEGSWLDHIIWDSGKSFPRPKLILNLQDEKMLFELLDNNDVSSLQSHAGAMIINPSLESSGVNFSERFGVSGIFAGRFDISNDKYYSNRKISQQLKTNAKKRSIYDLKVMHSIPALRLQTMKPKLSG